MRNFAESAILSCSARRGLRLALAVLCLACLAGQSLPCFAALSTKKAPSADPNLPAATRNATQARQNAPQAGGQQSVNPEALFAAMLVNAEKGQQQAMLTVGTLYEQGIGVPRNFTKALEWYSKAADAGERDAWMRLGICHEVGVGTTADMDKALAAYTRAASLGVAPARYKLAEMYLKGAGVAKDENKGFDFLAKAAEGGEFAAMYDMGQILRSGLFGRGAEPENARKWFAKAAEAGHAGSILALASMLKEGAGGKTDLTGALRWYLIGKKGGMSGAPLDAVIRELRGGLSTAKAEEAEKAADAWIAAKAKARPGQGQ